MNGNSCIFATTPDLKLCGDFFNNESGQVVVLFVLAEANKQMMK